MLSSAVAAVLIPVWFFEVVRGKGRGREGEGQGKGKGKRKGKGKGFLAVDGDVGPAPGPAWKQEWCIPGRANTRQLSRYTAASVWVSPAGLWEVTPASRSSETLGRSPLSAGGV